MVLSEEQRRSIEQTHLLRLRAFVLRARRILEHSLGGDAEQIVRLQHPSWTFRIDAVTGSATVRPNTYPPEETVESLTARVRPLILQGEEVHHSNVMKAVTYFVAKHDPPDIVREHIKGLAKSWRYFQEDTKSGSRYGVEIQHGDEQPERLSDKALGFAYIYGDTVHADKEKRAAGQAFGVNERFRAALPIVAGLTLHAAHTLRLVHDLTKSGVIPDLGEDVWKEDVVVKNTTHDRETRVWVREKKPGEQPQSFSVSPAENDGEWKLLHDAIADGTVRLPDPKQEPSRRSTRESS
jgi:hypothetical protein